MSVTWSGEERTGRRGRKIELAVRLGSTVADSYEAIYLSNESEHSKSLTASGALDHFPFNHSEDIEHSLVIRLHRQVDRLLDSVTTAVKGRMKTIGACKVLSHTHHRTQELTSRGLFRRE